MINYDDVDLGIIAIMILGIIGIIAGIVIGSFEMAGWSFAGTCVTGIAGLAGRGKQKDE
jgi:predicted Co/Zn/Cd cation transporter (cation efflux family)